jgi:uncharacterized protein (TIGR02217 family)
MTAIPSFHDVRFPLAVAFGATGGPEWRSEIVALTSGMEQRNARWARSRRHFDAGSGVRSLADLAEVLAFFEARRGSLYAFRFCDPFDHVSGAYGSAPSPGDQALGTGDGTTAAFQLVKAYGSGDGVYLRTIDLPVTATVRVAVAGTEKVGGSDFTVDPMSGLVTFAAGAVPAAGAPVTAGFEFDLAARFDTDRMTASITSFRAGEIPSIPIVEVKL